jgi:lysine biosynthesis protein LysW
MPKAYCPNCDGTVSVEKPQMGVKVQCRECNQELEVISTNPFDVDFPFDYDDDYGGEDDGNWDRDEY